MAELKAVLFDLDDTLVPEMKPENEALLIACRLATERYGINAQQMTRSVGEAANKLWATWSPSGLYSTIAYSGWEGLWGPPDIPDDGLGNDQETINQYKRDAWDSVLADFGIQDAELRNEIIERHRIERVGRIVPFPGAHDILREIRNDYLLGVVTNGSPAVQRFKLERSVLAGYFQTVVASGDVGVGKPNPLPFTTALEALCIRPEEATMIGNSWSSDIQGTADLGMSTIWFNLERAVRPETGTPPTFEVSVLTEIPDTIRRIATM